MNGPVILDKDLISASTEVKAVIIKIAEVAVNLSRIISLGKLCQSLDKASTKSDGDDKKNLNIIADEAYMNNLQDTEVRYYSSEEEKVVVELNSKGCIAMAIDPLDGFPNIDTNVGIGSIFSMRKIERKSVKIGDDLNKTFLEPGNKQIAAGYIIFGPQTMMVLTLGGGVQEYTLDRDLNRFFLTDPQKKIPGERREYDVNLSNSKHWSKQIQKYIEDSNVGEFGHSGLNCNIRWVASLVAETHSILNRGGIFIYPADQRKDYRFGLLGIVHKCAPIAFLIEQAGGSSTDCDNRILDIAATSLDSRTPFAFGSKKEVRRLQAYHSLPIEEFSPLFGKRGLFN